MTEIKDSCRNILRSCMGVRPGEQVLIVSDITKAEIGKEMFRAAIELETKAQLIVMADLDVSGQEPPQTVASAMMQADVVICVTEQSMTHTDAKINAVKNGARVGTMPGITEEMMVKGAVTADYEMVEQYTRILTEKLTAASSARIEKDGRVLRLDLSGRKGVASTGRYLSAGEAGNIPSGEAYIAPNEGATSGEVLIDGSMEGMGLLHQPVAAQIEGGVLRSLTGDDGKLGVLFEKEVNGIVGELGIGTNPAAILCGNILEDEKAWGTVHIAFGSNTSFGGTNKADCHMDGIILKPDLYLDEEKLMEKGRFLIF